MAEHVPLDKYKGLRRAFLLCLSILAGFVSVAFVALKLYLATPLAARQLSGLLTDRLGEPVDISGMSLSGSTISLYGLTIGSPDAAAPPFLTLRSLSLTPDWHGILNGKRSLARVTLKGARLSLSKGPSGWNFAGIVSRLATGKPAPETFIRRLELDDAALLGNGWGVEHLSVTVRELATKGSTASSLALSFRDRAGNPYTLRGSARLGKKPDCRLELSAPTITLAGLKPLFKGRTVPDLAKGKGSVTAVIELHERSVTASGRLTADALAIPVGTAGIPLAGSLEFRGEYLLDDDRGHLVTALQANGLLRLRADLRCTELRRQRNFQLAVALDELELEELWRQLPVPLRRDLQIGGRLGLPSLRLAGNGVSGVQSGDGELFLRQGRIRKGGRLICDGVQVSLPLTVDRNGWRSAGSISQQPGGEQGVLQALIARIDVAMSPRLKLINGKVTHGSGRLAGIPFSAEAEVTPAGFTAKLAAPPSAATELNRYLEDRGLRLSSGIVAATAVLAGTSPQKAHADVTVHLKDLRGTARSREFALGDGSCRAHATLAGEPAVQGDVRLAMGSFGGKPLAGKCGFAADKGRFRVTGADIVFDRTRLRLDSLGGDIPRWVAAPDGRRLPLKLAFSGGEVTGQGTKLVGLSGELGASYIADPFPPHLEGSGELSLGSLVVGSTDTGPCTARLSFARTGIGAEVTATPLSGKFSATLNYNPLGKEQPAAFAFTLRDLPAAKLGQLRSQGGVRPAAGIIDASGSGSYSAGKGVDCTLEIAGKELALAGTGGRALVVTGLAIGGRGEIRGEDFLLPQGMLATAEGARLAMSGKVARFAAADRAGEISCRLATMPLNSLFDTFANLLPKGMQEASAQGSLGGEGSLRFSKGRMLLEGSLALDNAGLDLPAQKISIADVRGSIPFSLELTGNGTEPRRQSLAWTRDNYPDLLEMLRRQPRSGAPLHIGRVRFGPMETGETTIAFNAQGGLTEISSFSSTLSRGALLGRGFVHYRNGVQYGGDFLLHNLSLKEFCAMFPAITGYMSGRLDGIISLQGGRGGVAGMTGFVDLWTRAAKEEPMKVSKEFLQKLAGKKLRGIFFRDDRPYDRGEIGAYLQQGYLTFYQLDISHTNFFGVKDLSVSVAPVQNRIALTHLFQTIQEAAARGKAVKMGDEPSTSQPPPQPEFKWLE